MFLPTDSDYKPNNTVSSEADEEAESPPRNSKLDTPSNKPKTPSAPRTPAASRTAGAPRTPATPRTLGTPRTPATPRTPITPGTSASKAAASLAKFSRDGTDGEGTQQYLHHTLMWLKKDNIKVRTVIFVEFHSCLWWIRHRRCPLLYRHYLPCPLQNKSIAILLISSAVYL